MVAYPKIEEADTSGRGGRWLQPVHYQVVSATPLQFEEDWLADGVCVNPEAIALDVGIIGSVWNDMIPNDFSEIIPKRVAVHIRLGRAYSDPEASPGAARLTAGLLGCRIIYDGSSQPQ